MPQRHRSWIVVILCAGVALWLGCGPQTPPEKQKRKSRPPVEKKVAPETATEKQTPKPEEEKAPSNEKAAEAPPSRMQAAEKEKPAEKVSLTVTPKEDKPAEKPLETAKPTERPAGKGPEAETPKAEKSTEKPIEAEPAKPEKAATIETTMPKHEKKMTIEVEPSAQEKPAAAPAQLPVPAGVPKVVMSDTDLAESLVKVGDKMPVAELPDAAGKAQSLQGLTGEKATLVIFWTAGNIAALQQLLDLKNDILEPYGKEGVRVVVIDEGDKSEQVKDAVEQTHPNFPILLDSEGSLFAKVATARLPRTYVLDATGRIVWFDIGYSPVMREGLLQTVRAMVGKTGP